LGIRIFFARLASGSLEVNGQSADFKDELGFTEDPEPFKELLTELYIDRIGLRLAVEENRRIQGRVGSIIDTGNPSFIPELDFGGTRVGLDIDLIRHPMLRLGIDADYAKDTITFKDRGSTFSAFGFGSRVRQIKGANPITIGVHGRAMPGRIRDVPITLQGRFRIPLPGLNRPTESKITDWEISTGLRPVIWDTSLYGHGTFSFDVEIGYRSTSLEMSGHNDEKVKARWHGAFVNVGFQY